MHIAALNYVYSDQESVNKIFARRKKKFGYSRIALVGNTAWFGHRGSHDSIMWRVHENITDSSKRRMMAVSFLTGRDIAKSGKFRCEMRRTDGKHVAWNIW